ncbi:hypothetical protein X975_10070, partial [Stegodyphus mimosarum]
MRSAKDVEVPLQQEPARMRKRKRIVKHKEKRQTTEPKTQEEAKRISQPVAGIKRKQPDETNTTHSQDQEGTRELYDTHKQGRQVKNYRSLHKCMTCKLPHHTVLHYERNSKIGENEKPKLNTALSPSAEVFLPRIKEVVTNATTYTGQFSDPKCSGKRVLLCTAVIKVSDSSGKAIPCRALLDCLSEECAKKLKLRRCKSKIEVSCLGSFNTLIRGQVELNFTSHFESNSKFRTYAYVIPKITSDVPNVSSF